MGTFHGVAIMLRRTSGFTLIELLVCLGILTILLVIAMPSFAGLKQRSTVTATHNLLLTGFATARNHAVSTGQLVTICPVAGESGCRADGVWDEGWAIFVDINRNGRLDAADTIVRHENRMPGGIGIYSGRGRPRAVFRPDGSAGGTNLSLRICAEGVVQSAVILSNVGRARSASTGELATLANCG